MAQITTSDFKKGIYIEFRGEACQMADVQFVSPGKGSAFVRTKLKNIKNGRVLDFTFKSGDHVEELPVEVHDLQYIYKDQQGYVFMNPKSYEQVTLDDQMVGGFSGYLKEGHSHQVLIHNGEPISIRIPAKVKLKVTHAEDGAAGNTVSGTPTKPVTLETGVTANVPIFIKEGETIIIRPETGEYLGRESDKAALI